LNTPIWEGEKVKKGKMCPETLTESGEKQKVRRVLGNRNRVKEPIDQHRKSIYKKKVEIENVGDLDRELGN